jgi:uncharacterized protein (UPF0335 family)
MTNNKVRGFADRLQNLVENYKADVDSLKLEAEKVDVDFSGIRRLVSWRLKDAQKRAEQEAIDEQYRFLAGERPTPAEIPPETQLAQAAELFGQDMTVRGVSAALKISVGKAQKLRTLAALFGVHVRVNVNTAPKPTAITSPDVAALPTAPPHDPDTGELTEPDMEMGKPISNHHAVSRETEKGSPPPRGDAYSPSEPTPPPSQEGNARRASWPQGRHDTGQGGGVGAIDHAAIEADDLAIPEFLDRREGRAVA